MLWKVRALNCGVYHSVKKCLDIYYMPGTLLQAGETQINLKEKY